jgi:hypothetical protein
VVSVACSILGIPYTTCHPPEAYHALTSTYTHTNKQHVQQCRVRWPAGISQVPVPTLSPSPRAAVLLPGRVPLWTLLPLLPRLLFPTLVLQLLHPLPLLQLWHTAPPRRREWRHCPEGVRCHPRHPGHERLRGVAVTLWPHGNLGCCPSAPVPPRHAPRSAHPRCARSEASTGHGLGWAPGSRGKHIKLCQLAVTLDVHHRVARGLVLGRRGHGTGRMAQLHASRGSRHWLYQVLGVLQLDNACCGCIGSKASAAAVRTPAGRFTGVCLTAAPVVLCDSRQPDSAAHTAPEGVPHSACGAARCNTVSSRHCPMPQAPGQPHATLVINGQQMPHSSPSTDAMLSCDAAPTSGKPHTMPALQSGR